MEKHGPDITHSEIILYFSLREETEAIYAENKFRFWLEQNTNLVKIWPQRSNDYFRNVYNPENPSAIIDEEKVKKNQLDIEKKKYSELLVKQVGLVIHKLNDEELKKIYYELKDALNSYKEKNTLEYKTTEKIQRLVEQELEKIGIDINEINQPFANLTDQQLITAYFINIQIIENLNPKNPIELEIIKETKETLLQLKNEIEKRGLTPKLEELEEKARDEINSPNPQITPDNNPSSKQNTKTSARG